MYGYYGGVINEAYYAPPILPDFVPQPATLTTVLTSVSAQTPPGPPPLSSVIEFAGVLSPPAIGSAYNLPSSLTTL